MENENRSGRQSENPVTLNSVVEVHDMSKDQKYTVRLVPPANVNVTSKWFSVHSPIGRSLLGRKPGDTVTWEAQTGTQTVKILRVREGN